MHKRIRKFKRNNFITGFILALVLSTSFSYATKYAHEVQTTAKITKAQQNTARVKSFYKKHNPKLWDSLAEEMAEATVAAVDLHDVPLSIQVGVNIKESDVHPFAKSVTGAKGMGQVDFAANREDLGEGNPYEPAYNQKSSAFLLKQKIKLYGVNKGLEIYNVGEGNYKKGRRNKKYVAQVLHNAAEFKKYKL